MTIYCPAVMVCPSGFDNARH